VSALCASGPVLFSGDAQGGVRVWDLTGGAVKQTLDGAHTESTHPAIMALLVWEGHLVTGSLDGFIKVWEPADPITGSVINPTPVFIFPEADQQQQQHHSGGRGSRRGGRSARGHQFSTNDLPGVLSLCGVADATGKSVIMAAYNGENSIRLLELPTFADRGVLSDVHNVRAMAGFPPGRLMMSGDEHGRVKVWRWKEPTGSFRGATLTN